MSANLEERYRRVLRVLPGYYRQQWEEDMVAAFLDSWLTGDPETDDYIMQAAGPSWSERASVIGLAIRLYLGGSGAPRRFYAWGQATRGAVLVVLLLHAVGAIAGFVYLAWTHRLIGSPPVPVASTVISHAPPHATVPPPGTPVVVHVAQPDTIWPAATYAVGYAWIVAYVAMVTGYRRISWALVAVANVTDLIVLVRNSSAVHPPDAGAWAYWVLFDLTPILALAAFHRDAPPIAARRWLLALPVSFLVVAVPLLALQLNGHAAWVPGTPGLCCALVIVLCLAHAHRARSAQITDSGTWSLTLIVLAAVTAVLRIVSLGDGDYLGVAHMALWQLIALVLAAALVAPDAARAQTAGSEPERSLV
jgi:hypothetical protein